MNTPIVVEVEIAAESAPRLSRIGIVVQVDLLVLERAPEALGENVVQRATCAVHTDLDPGLLEAVDILRRSEVRALIAVPDLRSLFAQGALDGFHHAGHLQRLLPPPTKEVRREPIDDQHAYEAAAH